MRDPQTAQFRKRLKRINRIHKRGGGFEADGTLGQSFYNRQRRRKVMRTVRPMLYIMGIIFVAKAFLVADLGTEEYLTRVSNLEAGSAWEQAGAIIMRVDPVTQNLADLMAPLFNT